MRSTWKLLGIPLVAGLTLAACGDSQANAGPEADPMYVSQTEEPSAEGAEEEGAGTGTGGNTGTEAGGATTGEEGEADEGAGEGSNPDAGVPDATAVLRDASGAEVGSVSMTEGREGMEVVVEVQDMAPGFHGLHVHTVGVCEPDSAAPDDPAQTGDFLSAGGHLDVDGDDHGNHDGDLPPLLVTEDGTARLVVLSDRLTGADVFDQDGAALMIHSARDNFAHVPERYGEPDDETLRTGDAGERVACAVLER